MTFERLSRDASHRIQIAAAPLWISISLFGCGAPAPESAPATTALPSGAEGPSAFATETDPDDVPITEADVARPKNYADALSRIEGYRDTIRDEIAAGRPTKAHRGLDELDIVLNWLPAIARDSGVPKQQWEKVNVTAKEIQNLFNQVHGRIDAKQEPDYGSVANAIDTAIGVLKNVSETSKPSDPELEP